VAVGVGRSVGVVAGGEAARGNGVAVGGRGVGAGVDVEMMPTPVGKTAVGGSAVALCEAVPIAAQAHNPSAQSIQGHFAIFWIIAQNKLHEPGSCLTCGTICSMYSEQPAPRWLWRSVSWSLGVLLVIVLGVGAVLALGAADPPRAGPLLWMDDFKAGSARWRFLDQGAQIGPRDGALVIDLAANQVSAALTARPDGDFTVEMAGAQASGTLGAKYGLVWGWRDPTHYSAVLVNGNGYVEAYQLEGAQRHNWFEWQQWPNLLFGTDANRVRADVRGRLITIRINDEFLLETTADTTGEIGVLARDSVAPSRVVVSWVDVWGK
jgi:hypothetical protein